MVFYRHGSSENLPVELANIGLLDVIAYRPHKPTIRLIGNDAYVAFAGILEHVGLSAAVNDIARWAVSELRGRGWSSEKDGQDRITGAHDEVQETHDVICLLIDLVEKVVEADFKKDEGQENVLWRGE